MSGPTVLLTLGRLPKALDLARGFARIGARVLVAEPFGSHVTGASRHVSASFKTPAPAVDQEAYLERLVEITRRERVDLVVPVSEETPRVARLRARLDPGVRLFTMPPDAVLALHDKAGFVRRGLAHGLAVPTSHLLGDPAAEAMARADAVVVKPTLSCSGRGVRFLAPGATLPEPDPAHPAIVQRFVPGRVHSSCTLAREGRVVSTIIYRGVLMSGSVAVGFERVIDQPAIEAWVERFVAAENWSGFISFDLVLGDDGSVHGIECNPRLTSGVHFWRSEDVARAVLEPNGGHPVGLRPETRLQQFYACLTETQRAMFRGRGFLDRLRFLLTTPDVTWDRRDPLPFLTMPVTSWRIIAMALARGVPFGEVATLDVGWYAPG